MLESDLYPTCLFCLILGFGGVFEEDVGGQNRVFSRKLVVRMIDKV
jgi:hypothetical protein